MTNGDKLSLISEVKEKHDHDSILLDLMVNIHKQRVITFE